MSVNSKDREALLRRLILAELIAKPGQGPLALRGPLARHAAFGVRAHRAGAPDARVVPARASEVKEP